MCRLKQIGSQIKKSTLWHAFRYLYLCIGTGIGPFPYTPPECFLSTWCLDSRKGFLCWFLPPIQIVPLWMLYMVQLSIIAYFNACVCSANLWRSSKYSLLSLNVLYRNTFGLPHIQFTRSNNHWKDPHRDPNVASANIRCTVRTYIGLIPSPGSRSMSILERMLSFAARVRGHWCLLNAKGRGACQFQSLVTLSFVR